jgi:hypothetical protein
MLLGQLLGYANSTQSISGMVKIVRRLGGLPLEALP